ncbi:plexin-A4-like [Diadema antillarum]|uniref:plexin-A4-like n=1 Tax=Diadema antillarum TaxID=105358 RepID=UPI003A88F43B
MPVRMYVQWNGENVVDDDGLEITLYNCSVDRDSCSRCLSPQRSPPELNCQWCGNICAFGGSSVCTAVDPVMQNTSTVCGNPKILDLKPRSGPLEGNTVVMLTGTDFGQEFSDITSVTIGDLPCSLEGMMEFYDPGRSVSCKTSAGNEESVRAKISVTSNGRTVQGTGGPTFSYVNPTISDFNPKIGPLAGGTKVIITGTHLDTGSEITAMFGNTSCVFEGDKTNEKATCRTTEGESLVRVPLTIYFDGAPRHSTDLFTFQSNPVITSLSTEKTIVAGGTRIVVTGTGFDAIQSASLVVSLVGGNGENYSLRGPCYPNNATTITCTSPAIPTAGLYNMAPGSRRRRATEVSEMARGTMTLILDGHNITLDNELVYYRNPVYDAFEDGVVDYGETIVIKGKYLNAASTKEDVVVEVGIDNGTILSLGPEVLLFTPPPKQPQLRTDNNSTKNMPLVVVRHGTSHVIGYIDYSKVKDNSMMTMIIIISAIGGTIVIIVLIFICLYFTSKRNFKKELARVEIAMAEMEDTFKNEATKAFIDIQQDMTGIKDQLKDLGGMPFVSSQDYVRNMLFVGQGMQPLTVDPQLPEENLKKAMTDFSKLLNNKDFLLVFIRSLDEDKKLQMKERQNIASLLTVVLVLEGKLSYLTEVMLTLMLEEITTAADTERYRQLFKRTETIVEKMLANWMALCMYSYLQKHVAYPLYLLYQAIKFQVEKGPVDVITGHAHYSLNYEYLLDEDVNFHEVNLQVENRLQEMENNMVKVLSVDTITQVKTKILDAVFRNKPLSARYITLDVDLVLRSGKMGQLVLRDTDNTTEKPDVNRWAKVNTISHYAVSLDRQSPLSLDY